MLEGAFYGLDLLKLHSVTTKLVGRVDKLEEVRKSPVSLLFLQSRPEGYNTLVLLTQPLGEAHGRVLLTDV